MWAMAMLLAVVSLVFGYLQLAGLPDLGVRFGPGLTVRAVPVDRGSDTDRQEFKRGDRLVALEGQSVEDLRDLRTVLRHLPDAAKPKADAKAHAHPKAPGEALGDDDGADQTRTASYQIVRPLHRFPIALQGKNDDPTALPPGVLPTDRLVELDGRKLQTKVGPEAVRSIIASRPEALLVFERKNAVFSGTMKVPEARPPYGAFGAFGLVMLVLVVLWWFRAEELPPGAVAAVGFETLCFGWIALLAFEYQWMLSDYALTAVVLAAFAFVRPFAFFARNIGEGRGTLSGWSALVLGVGATAATLGLLFGGYFETSEQALHVAALIAGLFVVYEIFLASVDDSPGSTLGEGTGYIAWILVLSLFSALLAWYLAPISFEENRWRWFAAVVVGLVWFGDVLYCFRGPASSGFAAIVDSEDRHFVLLDYLAQVRELIPEVRAFFVVLEPRESVKLEPLGNGLHIAPTSEPLHDAVSILVQEGVRVPLPDIISRQAHPMGGIAKTMNMALALRVAPPEGGICIDDVDIVLVGIEEAPAGELPVRPPDEVLDALQHLLSTDVWTAALVEGVAHLHGRPSRVTVTQTTGGEEVAKLQAELEELRAQLAQGGADGTPDIVEPDDAVEEPTTEEPTTEEPTTEEPIPEEPTESPGELSEATQEDEEPSPHSGVVFLDEAPSNFADLLEPELVDALEYLLGSPEPIVLAGAPGTGKTFIARCANALETDGVGELAVHDAELNDEPDSARLLFGDGVSSEAATAPIVEACTGGALLIHGAEHLSDTMLLRLCQAAEFGELRLYLEFDDPDAESQSVLVPRSAELQELLEHRELVVPRLAHRPTILQSVLEGCLADLGEDGPSGFAAEALVALQQYEFPGQFGEARELVAQAASRAEGAVIEVDDLALDAQSA